MKPIVIKRDGRKAPFNRARIEAAVNAAKSLDKETVIYALNVALAVELSLVDSIEDIEPQEFNTSVLIAFVALLPDIGAKDRCAYVSNVASKLCIERPNNRSPPHNKSTYPASLNLSSLHLSTFASVQSHDHC